MHLHRGFKPREFKTQLGLAMSRLKVLRNMKRVAVNQLKKEVAQLLESGQDQAARIRVEHVIREEKIMFVYDLLDVYCEVIVTRLQIIESQKICPTDLREAISSVIFASPRCADVPELGKARKQFSAKYGKDFVNSALEVRPNCGVTPLLVEKLSAKAPDIETKVKVLTSIASENGIKWEPKSFEESLQRPNEVLKNSFGRSSDFSKPEDFLSSQTHESVKSTTANETTYPASDLASGTKLQVPTSFASKSARESTKLDFSLQGGQRQAPPVNGVESSTKSSETISFATNSTTVMQSRPTTITPEPGTEGKKIGFSYSGEEFTVADQANCIMGFKDAASAAQAAAESAEQASMAARVAAEFAGLKNGPRLQYGTLDGEHPESFKFDSEPTPQEQVKKPTKETEELHRTNSGSSDWLNRATKGTYPKRYGSDASYASHSFDNRESIEEADEAHILEGTIRNASRQSSFSGDSGPNFDGDSSYGGDYVDFENFGNNEVSSSFLNKGSRSTDSSSYFEPWPQQKSDESLSNGNPSLQTHSRKKSDAENVKNTRKDTFSSPSLNAFSPSYDPYPEERKEVDCIDLLTQQTVKGSENPDHSNNESESVLKMENLTGGLRNRGFLCPPYIKSSSEVKLLASKESSTASDGQGSFYQRSQGLASEERIKTTAVDSDVNAKATSVRTPFLSHKTPDISAATATASVPTRQKFSPISESSKLEVFNEEPCLKESDLRGSLTPSCPSNDDCEDARSYRSYATSRAQNIVGQSRRTRDPRPLMDSKNLPSKSPEREEVPFIQRNSQEDILGKSADSEFLPLKSQTGGPVPLSQPKEGAQRRISSDGNEDVGHKPPRKPGTRAASMFEPPAARKKNIDTSDEDDESSSQESNEDSKPSPWDSAQPRYPERTQRTHLAAPRGKHTQKVERPISSRGDSVQTSYVGKETPKSISNEDAKKPTAAEPSQGVLQRNLSVEIRDKAKHVHPKLPDSDKLRAHFQALRTNVRK